MYICTFEDGVYLLAYLLYVYTHVYLLFIITDVPQVGKNMQSNLFEKQLSR